MSKVQKLYCKKGRKRRFSECGTQTDPLKEWLQPIVMLNKLVSAQKITSAKPSEACGSTDLGLPPRGRFPNRKRVSKIPESYRNFAISITNKERSNSTLVEEANAAIESAVSKCVHQDKAVPFIKPGPLSYKQRVVEELNKDMQAPITLANRSVPEGEKQSSFDLGTILEEVTEPTTAPDLDVSNLQSVEAPNLDTGLQNTETRQSTEPLNIAQNIETRTEPNLNDVAPQISNKTLENIVNVEVEGKGKSKHVNVRLNAHTTIISHRSSPDARGDGDFNDENDENVDVNQEHYCADIKIKATNVHIYNYFCKQ